MKMGHGNLSDAGAMPMDTETASNALIHGREVVWYPTRWRASILGSSLGLEPEERLDLAQSDLIVSFIHTQQVLTLTSRLSRATLKVMRYQPGTEL
jgi:hypothetical protein